MYQQYVSDLIDNVKEAVVAVDPTPFFTRYGNNSWAAVQTYQAAQLDYAAAPVIEKYTGVLAAVDVYTASTAFHAARVDPPRPRLRLADPPVTGAGAGALPVKEIDEMIAHAASIGACTP